MYQVVIKIYNPKSSLTCLTNLLYFVCHFVRNRPAMAKSSKFVKPLTVAKKKQTKRGAYRVDRNLYVQFSPTGGKSWLFRYMRDGKALNMGLGAYDMLNLEDAQLKAIEYRKLIKDGKDPKVERRLQLEKNKLSESRSMTFRQCADAYITSKKPEWRNEKHVSQWENTLRDYAYPLMGDLVVSDIDTDLVVKCLKDIWTTKTETATRVRGRIECVLDWAKTCKYRDGENPARWRGHLKNILPSPSKVAAVVHHPALGFDQIYDFIKSLRLLDGISPLALEFAILTAARTNEVIGATWDEIDIDKAIWTIPATRMKAGKEHRVCLSKRALEIVESIREQSTGIYLFPGNRDAKPLSNMALLMTLRRMNRTDLTAHGFRSTFKEWATEISVHDRDAIEIALAHTVGNEAELAYRRGDMLLKRRKLMEDWAIFCNTPPASGEVISITANKRVRRGRLKAQ